MKKHANPPVVLPGLCAAKAQEGFMLQAWMQDTSKLSGVGGTKDVFSLKSHSQESTPTVPVTILILRALQQALYAAEDYLEGSNP